MIKILQNIQPISFNKVLHAKHVAIPSEHGAWIFLFSPLLIGLAIGGLSKGSFPLMLAMLSAFLIRQPVTMFVKIISGRRPKNNLYASLIWFVIYGVVLLISLVILILQKSIFILFLAVPAIPVFIWHLWLVSKRAERRQIWIEIAASGVLALADWVPTFVPLAFLIQPLEVIWGTYHPAISVAPKKIGIRQLIISSLFTIVFIITWLLV